MDDFMLQDLTDIQKEYIIKELYPTLKQSIMHFIHKSMQTEDFKTKVDKAQEIKEAMNEVQMKASQMNKP